MRKQSSKRLLRCNRCRHVWRPRRLGKPRFCPACKSAFWDRVSRDIMLTRKRLTLGKSRRRRG